MECCWGRLVWPRRSRVVVVSWLHDRCDVCGLLSRLTTRLLRQLGRFFFLTDESWVYLQQRMSISFLTTTEDILRRLYHLYLAIATQRPHRQNHGWKLFNFGTLDETQRHGEACRAIMFTTGTCTYCHVCLTCPAALHDCDMGTINYFIGADNCTPICHRCPRFWVVLASFQTGRLNCSGRAPPVYAFSDGRQLNRYSKSTAAELKAT